LEFLKLLGLEMWRGVTNLVGTHQGADFGQLILCAEIGIRVAASESLLIAVQRMQRRVKCGGVIHSLFSDGDWGKGFKGVRATPPDTKRTCLPIACVNVQRNSILDVFKTWEISSFNQS
jgi:hypothetical protein